MNKIPTSDLREFPLLLDVDIVTDVGNVDGTATEGISSEYLLSQKKKIFYLPLKQVLFLFKKKVHTAQQHRQPT